MGDMANLAIPDVLRKGKENIEGMILAPSWSSREGDLTFGTSAKNLWGGEVDWTTAMSYNAAKAIIKTLEETPIRNSISKKLKDGIEIGGASGEFHFQGDGSVNPSVYLVGVCKTREEESIAGYNFLPLENCPSS